MRLSIASRYFVATAVATSTCCSAFITKSNAPLPSYHNGPSPLEAVSDAELDRLFNKYDADANGSISKEEFRAVADKMRASSSRREILSVAAASFGSVFVATGSNTFQWGQKQFRSKYIEQDAEISQQLVFPTAILSGDADRAIAETLRERGFTPQNTLFAHSICSDEVNNRSEQLVPLMSKRWGEAFTLGGLAGLPFAGKSGFSAYFHHVPENGKLLVMFAPHVGIGPLGRIGALQRDGQDNISSACGAAVGAYKELQKKKASPVDPVTVLDLLKDEDTAIDFDPQLKTIVDLLKPRLKGIEDSSDSIAFVTYQMYGIIRELLYGILDQTPDLFESCSEVAIVGGLMINRRIGGDFFQPMSFETCTKDSKHIDLFETAFGERPNLVPILGSEEAVERLFVGGSKK